MKYEIKENAARPLVSLEEGEEKVFGLAVPEGGLYVITLWTVSHAGTARLDFEYGEQTRPYYIPVQKTEIRIPVTGQGGQAIFRVAGPCRISLWGLSAEKVPDDSDLLALGAATGMFCRDDFLSVPLRDPGADKAVGAAMALADIGDYLLCVGEGRFRVITLRDPGHPQVVATLSGLGATRQMAVNDARTHAYVTGRQDGVTIVDITCPEHPFVAGHYDSVEMATGIGIYGNLAFVANRQYGMEILDITDPVHPKNVGLIRSGEVQSCHAADGYLYAGLWGERNVTIYDIHDISDVKKVGVAPLDGKGDGFAVAKSADGKKTYLYAATGQAAGKVALDAPITDLAYGFGNGLEIFDVTDPAEPKKLSVCKVDGRYYYPQNDYWETVFSRSAEGRAFAYLVNTYNGVYVFDVTEPAAPVRCAHLYIPVPADSPNYTLLARNKNRTILLPFDPEKEVYSPVGSLVAKEGYLYLAGVYTDVHVWENPAFAHAESGVHDKATFETADLALYPSGFDTYRPGTQVYCVAEKDGLLYAACGAGGIHVLTPDMKCLCVVPTEYAVQYLHFAGHILFSSQTQGGVRRYLVDGEKVTPLGASYVSARGVVRMAVPEETGRYALVQAGSGTVEVVDFADAEHPKKLSEQKAFGNMYYRNICPGLVAGRYGCAFGFGSQQYFFDFGGGEPTLTRCFAKGFPTMKTGVCALGDRFLMTTGMPEGYLAATMEEILSIEGDVIPKEPPVRLPGLSGKPTARGDLLAVSDRIMSRVAFYDISDVTAPRLLSTFATPGNPDLILIGEEDIYIPDGYAGLYRIRRSQIGV